MIKEAIAQLVEGQSLTQAKAAEVMDEIMAGQATPAQLGAFLIALRMNGETAAEITGMAGAMRAQAIAVEGGADALDIVGTGGDGARTFNISTTAAFVAAGAGLRVAKHGNRAASGRCGSADVLEALGANLTLTAEQAQAGLVKVGIVFLFAPAFHPAMKYAAGPRREIGVRTVFNILGPMVNPARPAYLVLGVADPSLGEAVAKALPCLGVRRAMVVYGCDGTDEVSLSGPTMVWETGDDGVSRYEIAPMDFGLAGAPLAELEGGEPAQNAAILRAVLAGEISPRRDAVLLNAAAALYVAGKAPTLREGVTLAAAAIDSGRALQKLEQMIAFSLSVGGAA